MCTEMPSALGAVQEEMVPHRHGNEGPSMQRK